MKHALAIACLLLAGCRGFQGGGNPYTRFGLGTPARHNVEPMAGVGYEWEGGAECEVRYQPWLRVDDPSSRGFPREVGRVFAEVKVPIK